MACQFGDLPAEVLGLVALRFLEAAPHVATFAGTSPAVNDALTDSCGRLRLRKVAISRLHVLTEGLSRMNLGCLEEFFVDVSGEDRHLLRGEDVDDAITHLGNRLANASTLRVLGIRLASFGSAMERLRLGREAWEALSSGLGALAHRQQLRSLECSFMTMKPSHRYRKKTSAAQSRSFLETIGGIASLETLTLTYDEIYDGSVVELKQVLPGLKKLKRVDVTRNHISNRLFLELRAAVAPQVELLGADKQTSFFY